MCTRPGSLKHCGKVQVRISSLLDAYVGFYELTPYRVLTVARDGDRLSVQETGRAKLAVATYGADAFVSNHDDLLVFLRDGQAGVTQLLLQDPMTGAHLAHRVAVTRANTIEEEFARRIAAVPDRFRDRPRCRAAKRRSCEESRTCAAAHRTISE